MIKIFAHRGFTNGDKTKENTIESLDNAYLSGCSGVEFDVWLINNKLLLKHDQPKKGEILPYFSEYFKYGDRLEYWIDCKNMDENNYQEFLMLINQEIGKKNVDSSRIYLAPYITEYNFSSKVLRQAREIFGDDLNYVAVCDEIKNLQDELVLIDFLGQNRINHLSIFYLLINQDLLEKIGLVKIFAWTINQKSEIKKLDRLNIYAVASDDVINC